MNEGPLIVRGQGQSCRSTLEDRLKRCDLELKSVLKLNEQMEVNGFDLRSIRSIFLEKNEDFKALLNHMKEWNEEVRASKTKKKVIARAGYRYHLMKYLCSNLREVTNTRDRQVQLFYLKQLREWFDHQNQFVQRPQTQGGRMASTLTRPGTSSVTALNQISFFQQGDELGPKRTDFDDFQGNHRTKYSFLNPPEERIKEFTKKELGQRKENQSANGTRPNTVILSSFSRPMTQGSQARPSTNLQSLRMLSNVDMSLRGMSRGGIASSQSQFRDDKFRSPGKLSQVSSLWNYTDALASLHQKSEQFESIKLTRFEEYEEFGQSNIFAAEPSQKDIPQHFQPSRKAFKFDMNSSYAPQIRQSDNQKSTYINYNPSDEVEEIRLENMWYINRNKAVSEKRENEELENHIKNWSINKGLIDQEINRKNEMTFYGSKFHEIGRIINEKIPQETLSEKNFLPKQVSELEKEEENEFEAYVNIVRKSQAERHAIAHPLNNEESLFQIAQKIDLSILSPRMEQDITGFQQGIQNLMVKQNSLDSDKIFKKQKSLDERPKTQYVSLREDLIGKHSEDQHPFLDLELQMKRIKIDKLRSSKGKIIGLSVAKTGEEPDEEDILRRKQQSLQMYHQKGHQNWQYRPFTSVYKHMSKGTLEAEELLEIQKVRRSFVKSGIKCSINTIKQSLSRPQGLPSSSLQLPLPGSMLFTNPFVTFGKKITSKKKKKSS